MFLTLSIIVLLLLFLGGCTFYATQERMIFFPEAITKGHVYKFNGTFKELFIKSGDGLINAIHFKTPNPKGVILYFHGNAGSLTSWGSLGEEYMKSGYDFFIFDYRGYGKSTGPRKESIFHQDAQVLYNYLLKDFREDQIVLYGRSLGSGFATKLASENHPKALILETPYYNFKDVAKFHFPFLPVGLILRWKIPTNEWISKVKSPILIFHGTKDEVIPYIQTVKLKNLIKPQDHFITLQEGNHSNTTIFPEYSMYMNKYLN